MAQRRAEPLGSAGWLGEAIRRLGGAVPENLGPSSALEADLALDSLARMELLAALEARFGLDLDETAFTAQTTVADIERMLRGEATGPACEHRYPFWAQRAPATWVRRVALYALILPITSLLCWVRVCGRDRLAGVGEPVLFIANHVTMADAPILLTALPGRFRRRLAIMMSGEMLRGYLHPPDQAGLIERSRLWWQYALVVLLFAVFPIPQLTSFRRSFLFAEASMRCGYSILLFPEGQRTQHGGLNPFMAGAGALALRLGARVVPVRIDGLYKAKKSGFWPGIAPGRVTVTIGDPIEIPRDSDARLVTDMLEARFRGL